MNVKSMLGGFVLLILFSLVSCATTKTSGSSAVPIYVTNSAKYILLPPANIDVLLDMAQHISGRYGNQQFVMDAWVQADTNAIVMTLFNNFGSNMGTLTFDGKIVLLDSPFFPSSLNPQYVIADFQFCFYRSDMLAESLKSIGLDFEISNYEIPEIGFAERRTILSGTQKIIEIEKTPQMIRYINLLRGYSYTLEGEFNDK